MSDAKLLKTVITELTLNDNGGEAVVITTEVYDNGDFDANSQYTLTEITLESYGRSASMSLGDILDNGRLAEHLAKLKGE